MAERSPTDGQGIPQRSGGSAPHRDSRVGGRGRVPAPVRKDARSDLPRADEARASHQGDPDAAGSGVVVGSGGDLWLPENGADLSIYKRMLKVGAIRPFTMPQGVERLADHVMGMLEVAQASGRMRDAIKCIEILRMLMTDNRQIALEVDKIDRLDAGKPTSISSQVSNEVQDRIKRIISTQRARPLPENTEDTNDGSTRKDAAEGVGDGAGRGREQSPIEAILGRGADRGTDQGQTAARIERVEDPQAGGQG